MRFRSYGMTMGFVLLAWLLGCLAQEEGTFRFLGGLGSQAEQMLAHRDVPLNWEGRILSIASKHRSEVVDVLCEVLHTNAVAMTIHQHNLANAHTIRTADGEPYRRQYLIFRKDGYILGVRQDMSDFNWCYDPTHPDSMKEGPKHGYVAKPNVNPGQERSQLRALEKEQEALRKVLNQIAPDIIVFDQVPALGHVAKKKSPPLVIEVNALEEATVSLAKLMREFQGNRSSHKGGDFSEEWLVSQTNTVDSGQVSVANALNWIHQGRNYDSKAIDEKYGFALLKALNGESAEHDLHWRDAGNLNSTHWAEIAETVNQKKLPVILAFNGEPAPNDLGYIVTIIKVEGERVTYADPYLGTLKTTTKEILLRAKSHPDGNFVFLPQ